MRIGRHGWRATSVAVAVCLATLFLTSPSRVSGQASSVKLTTVLADLAASAPQDVSSSGTPASVRQPLTFATLPVSVQDAMRSRRLRIDPQRNVQVTVLVTAVTDDVLGQLAASGATVEIPDVRSRRVQVHVPVSRLQILAALPFVTFVRTPVYARHGTGAIETEGDAIINADVARQQFGVDGTGVKVGVISDGLKGVFATGCSSCGGVAGGPIASGDLPGATGTRNVAGVLISSTGGITGQSFASNGDLEGLPPASPPCGFAGAGAEGTALLEIVHDVAPGATLSFANGDTDLAFNRAVNALAAANDVVVDDFGFYGEPDDGTSDVSANTAAALNDTSNRIRAYITAVGNSADAHYLGDYADSGVDGTTIGNLTVPGHLHLFQSSDTTTDVLGLGPQPYDLISLPNGGEVVIFLTWNDPAGASSNNYDLYLVRQSTNAVVARSTDAQSGSQDPSESIDYTNTGASDGFRIVIQNVRNQAAPRQLNLYSFEPECANNGPLLLAAGRHELQNFNTASESVVAQSDAGGSPVSVISVGAICSGSPAAQAAFAGSPSPDESCTDGSHRTVEFYSSRGPTLDGRTKPDISAVDGVSVTGTGGFGSPFFGTSATGPHVAAEAALLLQAAPCLRSGTAGARDPATARGLLRGLILGGATPESDAPPDNVFGAGLANALASIEHALPAFQGPASLVVPGNSPAGATITPAALGFTDPDQCPMTELEWTGGCGSSPAGSLTCPFGTATLNVSASNDGVAFSPASTVQVTVSNFSVAAAPASATVTAGQTATYQLTITAAGGAFTNAVALSCTNLPPGSSCAFSPASVVPGAASVNATLTIATSARAASLGPARPPWKPTRPWATAGALSAAIVALVAILAGGNRRRRTTWWEPAGRAAGDDGRVSTSPRRSWPSAPIMSGAVVALIAAVVCADVACRGGSTSNQPPPSGSTVTVAPANLTFGSQTIQSTSAPQIVTLTNTGSAAVTIASIAASGDFSATNTCGGSVAAGASCTIVVSFTPTAAGSRTGSLTIADNATGSPQTVALAGTGVSAVGGTPAGTYQVAVTGTSGTLVQSGTVTVVVQ